MTDVHGKKICIVIPYFGQWPCWIDFFMESCRHNPAIDWLMYTDCGPRDDVPDNVKLHHCRFDDYKQRVSETLGIVFQPDNPYKLCDLKPAYGLIHQQELEGYDYWGFGDVDVIWGDLQSHLTADMLRYNLISFHANRISGHLCLLKNTAMMRTAFMRCKSWKRILSDKQNHVFDEKRFNELFIRHRSWPGMLRRLVYFPRHLMRTALFQESYSTSFGSMPWIDGSFDFPDEWCWDNGVLTSNISGEKSFAYLHFLHWKKHWPTDKQMQADSRQKRWYIRAQGIFSESSARE